MSRRISARLTTGLSLLLLVAGALVNVAHAADTPGKTFSFGIVPQQAPSKLLRSWGPLLKHLEEETGYRLVFKTAPDIPTFEKRLQEGKYDFAYMNPYHFTVFNQAERGYQAVARARNKRIRGIMVVRKDSSIATLTELDNTTLAFPAPAAFAASVLPRANLNREQIGFEAQYVSSHDSVYRSVAQGLFPAGGGVMRTFNATDPSIRDQLRVLWTTPGYTPHALAAREGMPRAVVANLRAALTTLDNQIDRHASILDALKVKGFEAANNTDWDDVRALNIDANVGTDG